ncbi:sugar kinase [Bdellovibrio bacteriovorus]|uniref:Sugar kinase n=1 Tax=Bdellovibrio bacteriovorus TaxID=959 RepID=A0A150WIP4_BDEBC|nr:PfkB family carbohydrate kinase [Bdellovibrio bacteriovorus]KYG63417.1 sugar kinase [Bdellovibrio bacteriovorus]
MSEILVVGSLAYDSIQTPSGKVDRALGGSANYFSLAASLFSKVRVVGVVGEDYDQGDYELLNSRGVDLSGLSKVAGKTFHWAGSYEGDMNEAKTLQTDLNVFEHFNPQLPEHFKDSSFVFLANIAPELQLQVLEQVKSPKFVGMDTMNFWISIKKEKLIEVLKKVDLVLINEGEAKMLTGAANAISAAPLITAMGPQAVVIKRGEYGFAMYTKEEGYFILPAMPIPTVVDPTGAGDTFAGGFFGYLAAQKDKPTLGHLKQACIMGSMMASHTIQDFSVRALSKVTLGDVERRLADYKKVITL